MDVTRKLNLSIAFAIATLAGAANGQQMPLDGSRPPVISVADATRSPSQPALPAPDLGFPTGGDVSPSAAIGPGVVADTLQPPPPKPRPLVKAPPARVELEPGKNYDYGVAVGHINRIVTPFAKPSLRTTSTASTSIEGSIVYVATQSEDPIGLFIFDESQPELAISLTLVPQSMPSVSTTVSLKGWAGPVAGNRRAANPSQAIAFEGQHPYLQTLTGMLKELAQGNVPDGYGFEALRPDVAAAAPACAMPGIHVEPRQLIVGGSFVAYVAKATNHGFVPADIREDLCRGGNLRAVASWPYNQLAPGQSTELYLVVGVQPERSHGQARPSVLGAH